MAADDTDCGCVSPAEHGAECYCAVTPLIHTLGKSHALSILSFIAAHEPRRFRDIQERMSGLSTSTIAARLQELEDAGVLLRVSYPAENRVEYCLSGRGRALQDLLRGLFARTPDDNA